MTTLLNVDASLITTMRNDKQMTPLMIAAESNNILMVDLLLSYEADVSLLSIDGRSALHYSISHPKILTLLSSYADTKTVNRQNFDGRAPLWYASYYGFLDSVKVLLQRDDIEIGNIYSNYTSPDSAYNQACGWSAGSNKENKEEIQKLMNEYIRSKSKVSF